jgi:hypothetical protein
MVMDKKEKLVIAACIVAILLLLGVSAGIYGNYIYQHIHQQQVSANQADQVLAAEAKSQENARKVFQYQLFLLTENCRKDIATAQKNKTAVPVCSPTLKPLQ